MRKEKSLQIRQYFFFGWDFDLIWLFLELLIQTELEFAAEAFLYLYIVTNSQAISAKIRFILSRTNVDL